MPGAVRRRESEAARDRWPGDLPYRLVRPILASLDPELAHRLAIRALSAGLVPAGGKSEDPILKTRALGRELANPIGLAAGFDKHGEVIEPLLRLGFGLVEIGTVTPSPQPGNSKPRLFRLPTDRAVINRYGFNSEGLDRVLGRMARIRGQTQAAVSGLVGLNVGKNKDAEDELADFAAGIERGAPLADYLVINISSPNTPGLRDLQARGSMERLVAAAQAARARAIPRGPAPPLLVKLAPDLDEAGLRDAASVALATGLDGLILGNTTLARPPDLRDLARTEAGGLSGRPLLQMSTAKLSALYRHSEGRLTLIGAGGVSSGADAYAKIRAGASLVQLYTALVFEGPGLVGRIKRELAACLRRDGFRSVAEAVGADHL